MSWAARCPVCRYRKSNPGGYLLRPVETKVVTSGYSPGHRAVDFGAAEGSPVFAAADGFVVETANDRWAGKVVRIQHEDGLLTVYGHLRAYHVTTGSFVRMGEVVALSGATGAITGPHLHFEVLSSGIPVSPLLFLVQ